MIEVFPAPVGPVIANRSNFEKSMAARWRKLVKPSISRLIGRIRYCLLVECAKQFRNRFRRFGRPLTRVKPAKQFERIGACHLKGLSVGVWMIQSHLVCVRENFAK